MWMHKESKWLIRGGRKVRCYLCGKKILKKDLFMFHENTGYYSHQSCMMETGTMDRNERRKAVKKIAMGAAVVGAIAAGAGKFIGVSSQSSQAGDSPAAQTILTPQGLILPALTSDPANPVPGQMWYRSDVGVTAHFDGIQNRVVYSSEINDGNVHVTSKGIINGLSVLPNDGTGWFGPDTASGATAPGQYGAPYTQTTGIQETFNYAAAKNQNGVLPEIRFSDGLFNLYTSVNLPLVGGSIPSFSMIGNGYGYTLGGTQIASAASGADLNLGTSSATQIGGGGFKIQGFNFYALDVIISGNYNANPMLIIRDVSLFGGALQLKNAYGIAQLNLDNVFSIGGDIHIGGAYQVSATNLTAKTNLIIGVSPNAVNQVAVQTMAEGIQVQYGNSSINFSVWELDDNLVGSLPYAIISNLPSGETSNININAGTVIINTTKSFFYNDSGLGTMNLKIHIKHLVFLTAVCDFTLPAGMNLLEFTVDEITNLTSTPTSSANLPIISSTAGTTAGTVGMRFSEYASAHKKMYITFSGYENDTATDQTIDFPMAFSSYAVIVANNTGLTISATTSGITITAPDSTTTYSGIVIVEGY